MSVVKLKLMKITGAREGLDGIVRAAAGEREFFCERADALLRLTGYGPVDAGDAYTDAAERLSTIAERMGVSLTDDQADAVEDPQALCAAIAALDERVGRLFDRMQALDGQVGEKQVILEQLSHIMGLDVELDQLFRLTHFKLRFGRMPAESRAALELYQSEADEYFFFPAAEDKGDVWGMYITPSAYAERVDAMFGSLHFERFIISDRVRGTPQQAYERLTAELSDAKAERERLQGEWNRLAREQAQTLRAYRAGLVYLERCHAIKETAMQNDEGEFVLCGYVPKRRAEAIAKRLCALPGISVSCADPAPDAAAPPPTVLRNLWFFRPFEEYVRMYGLPSYRELDPTPLVALTYMLFFGIMFGDVGQGALLILVGAGMWFFKKMFIGRILTRVGLSSIFFGLCYGSVFGYEDLLPFGFKVNEGGNMNLTLFGAVGIGVVIIILCLFMNIANGVRNRDPGKSLFSSNGVAALIFYLSTVLLVLSMLGFLPVRLPTVPIAAVICVSLLLILMCEPLDALLRRRRKLVPTTWVDYILESFFELFESVLSFVTNTISYIRLGAFALSHVGMMSVVFLLAQNSAGGYNPVIIAIGNLFVTAFEGLIVCIQALRLEYYEIFSRFYDGTGREPQSLLKE